MGKVLFIMALAVPALLAGGAFADDDIEGLAFESMLSNAQEVPVNVTDTSDGRGMAKVRFARDLSAVYVKVWVKNLISEVEDAHLHCAVAGQNGPVVLGLMPTMGVTKGRNVKGRFDNDDVDVEGCECSFPLTVNNIASLRFAADVGCIYVNVHTTDNPPGEVRAQMRRQSGKD